MLQPGEAVKRVNLPQDSPCVGAPLAPSTWWGRGSRLALPDALTLSLLPHRSSPVFKCLSRAEMTNLPVLMCWGNRHFSWRLLERLRWEAGACRDFGGGISGGCQSRRKGEEAHWCGWHPSSHPTKNTPSLLCLLFLIFRCKILSHSKQ